jgi:hypothetical protein
MFHTPIDRRAGAVPSSFDRALAFGAKPLQFPLAMDLCREQVPAAADCEGLRFAAAARKSASPQAFRPAFATGDWRVFASFCIARELPPDHRVLIPGRADRTLRFLVEGSLWQQTAGSVSASTALLPGTFLGADALFSDAPCALDVRTLEHSLVLELSLARQKELTAACPEIGFELLRAAGAVIASRGRPLTARELAAA